MKEQSWVKILLLVLLLLVGLPSISSTFVKAESLLTAIPSSSSVNMMAYQNTPLNITLTNGYNFNIYNISFNSPYVFSDQILQLSPNSTYSKTVNLYTTSAFDIQAPIVVKFNYFVNSTVTPTTHTIDITGVAFSPNNKVIKQGDTLNFHNVDSISHTLTSSLFSRNFAPGESWSFTFSSPGETTIFDDLGFNMLVTTQTNIQTTLTHNPDYDKTVNIHLVSYLQQTSINYEIIDKNINVTYGGNNQGLIKLTNNGTADAFGVTLSAPKWITFGSNNFSLVSGQNKYILYTITPTISYTNETNTTHSIPITVKGLNVPEMSQSLSAFISYHYLTPSNNLSAAEMQLEINRLKAVLEEYLRMLTQDANRTTVYVEKTFPVNYTASDVYELNRKNKELTDSVLRSENEIKKLNDWAAGEFQNKIGEIRNTTNVIAENTQKNSDRSDTNRALLYGGVILFTISAIVFLVTRYYKKRVALQHKNFAQGFGKQV